MSGRANVWCFQRSDLNAERTPVVLLQPQLNVSQRHGLLLASTRISSSTPPAVGNVPSVGASGTLGQPSSGNPLEPVG